jgi:hypothetical protein
MARTRRVTAVLRPNRKDVLETFAEPFRRYMKAIGWEEGRNIRFLFVWTEARSERAPALAGKLVAQNVDLIVTFGDPAIRAAQRWQFVHQPADLALGAPAMCKNRQNPWIWPL